MLKPARNFRRVFSVPRQAAASATHLSHEVGMRENLTPPKLSMKLSVKLSIDTHLLYGYSCGAGQIEIQFHLPAGTEREI
jgi:hypothetical protein